MARAARLSGADPDDEDYEEFEEMLEKAEGAQVGVKHSHVCGVTVTESSLMDEEA